MRALRLETRANKEAGGRGRGAGGKIFKVALHAWGPGFLWRVSPWEPADVWPVLTWACLHSLGHTSFTHLMPSNLKSDPNLTLIFSPEPSHQLSPIHNNSLVPCSALKTAECPFAMERRSGHGGTATPTPRDMSDVWNIRVLSQLMEWLIWF